MNTFERDSFVTRINEAAAELDELTTAEERDADAISAATVNLEALRSRLAAHDALTTPATIEAAKPEAPKSFGRSAAEALAGSPVGSRVEVRTLFTDPFGNDNGEQDVTFAQQTSLVTNPDAPVRFTDILPVAIATSDAVTYIKEAGFANAAAARITGDPAAESELTFTKVTEPIANIAHYIRVAEETLSDAPTLGAVIDRRGLSGIRSKLNNSLLGAADDVNGVKSVVAAATETTYDPADTSLIDAILGAKSDLEELGFAPTTVVLTPAQHEAILSAKTEQGAYLGAGPFGGGNGTVWGLRMVVDGALTDADALVCDTTGATLYVRQNADVATDRDIVSNLLTVRVQTRAQVAVEQPEAFVKLVQASGS